jgi:hypothetical protein
MVHFLCLGLDVWPCSLFQVAKCCARHRIV